jgi:uncharacterized Zn-binding protein involved in type VI secretion
MKIGIARVGDMTSGHDGYPGTPIITGSKTMFCDGKAIACVGDICAEHDKSKGSRHTPVITGGSSFFTVDGRSVAMVGSEVSGNCSSANIIISGSDFLTVEE